MCLWSAGLIAIHITPCRLPETFTEMKECLFVLKIHEIREIIKLIDQSSINEFKLETEGTKVTLKKSSGTENFVVAQPVAQAPMVQAVAAPVAAAPVAAPVAAEAPKAAPAAPVAEDANLHKIISPMVGTFYSSPEPGKPAYVQAGDKVNHNKVVCIVEAMKLFNEIEAEVSGEIVKVLAEDGQLVEYGQPLFLVKPE
jgi:acetyl-CoA carboxylase biotin carboxyl carrier protein